MQLKQFTQREASTKDSVEFRHLDLQLISHKEQLLHFSLLIRILKKENLDIKPKKEPTGQIELQYHLPFVQDIILTKIKLLHATIKEIKLIITTSISEK